ncbi:hypothetical protein ACFQY8_07630 [Alloscardovia venturai]|uniref:CopG family transcriptional regulator n=1 Tax=Alloscardovia venturai TaxID=1769421 RepID=A0ABW2Y8A5_9BIFI
MRQLNVLITAERHQALKRYAIEQSRPMADILSDWIDEKIEVHS